MLELCFFTPNHVLGMSWLLFLASSTFGKKISSFYYYIFLSLSGIMNHSAMLLFTLSNSSTLSTWRIPAKNLNSTEPLWKICSHASPKYLIIFSLLIYTFLTYTCIIIQKLWFQHIWPSLQQELRTQEVLAAALQPVFLMIQGMSAEEYHVHVMPTIRYTAHHFRLNLYT